MLPQTIRRSIYAGYTITIVEAAPKIAKEGARFRSLHELEERLEQVRRAQQPTGAVLRWSLHTDDRVVTYEGRYVFKAAKVDLCDTMTRHCDLILDRQATFPPATVARARTLRLAAEALRTDAQFSQHLRAQPNDNHFKLAVALMQTSLPYARLGGFRTLTGQA